MKKLISMLLALVMLFSFTACTQTTAPSADPTEAVVTEQSYPLTVTDQAGRVVTINQEPTRLVSGYYISTSVLIALELDDKLVGIEAKANKRPIYSLSAPELIELPNVGTAKEFDLEGCAALNPDLVILPLKLKGSVESLENLGITVILVNPESRALLSEMITLIGTATNTMPRANELLDFTSSKEAYLAEALADTKAPKVYLAGNSDMLSTAGNAMYQSDLISLAGGVNVAGEIEDSYWVTIDYEQLLTWDPEYIILASDASYTAEDVLADPNLAECTAVKNANVYQLPYKAESWDSPVPGGILGAMWLSNILHPEKISDSELSETIENYYETFYNFSYNEN